MQEKILKIKKNDPKIHPNYENLDTGVKVFKLQESNFKQWRKIKDNDLDLLEAQLEFFVDKIAEHSTPKNMVYELLLKNGKDLNSKIEHQNKAYIINSNELVFMLEEFSETILKNVIARNPQKVIALDRIFCDNDQLKTNTVLSFKDSGIKFETV